MEQMKENRERTTELRQEMVTSWKYDFEPPYMSPEEIAERD